ncbi:hypothetical protein D6850_12305 [Roseovarius spongiae]|uniref:SH3b domain-containing protein n=1 Tax=Roseovarius spongiae TaxID=2320272 RepID=A0A3A8AS57_9RHOB|nr:SH3 domain-containing protein [Roseovarius spongiae]RKF13962.1 hypothetical protein D6850_12305 [Roseovarius spongiae]
MKRILGLVLAGSLAPSLAPAGALFECEAVDDGAWRVFILDETPDIATAVFKLGLDSGGGESSPYEMERAVSGSGFRYLGEGLEFIGKSDDAMLIDGEEKMHCGVAPAWMMEEATAPPSQDGDGPLPDAPDVEGMSAQALGGNIRSGPGTQHARIGTLARGTSITLMQDTGEELDGYNWFVIRKPDGETGHVWGGIICTPEETVPGVRGTCD